MANTSSLANQMKARDREMVPRALVIAMFALMASALILVSYARITNRPLTGVAALPRIEAERTVYFDGDRTTGIRILDTDGQQIAASTDPKSGFIDVVWVAVMRERKVQGADPTAPIRLVRRSGGRTDILDDQTGWSLALIGYGQDNVAAFATLIDTNQGTN
ncbi:photosynthetic complex assembly protein PuhC [Sulfitobacter sp. S190]|uniref:photosynthetic complex assembly protein PuhC n=1 Tax=Sulfitobacter sp. S190 TaxID=2867022 RepID=UPI0021A85260|nr:photosynthetic complex assembly protein PuhC [Sulfitobacter sp. S190]UWR24383.1 photosynthetic complex assembly protein [Sulfitobacter sp. S190]